jgi:sugar lactone lactonase YvrE
VVVHEVGAPVGCLGLRESGGYLVATARGVAVADDDWQSLERVADLPGQATSTRTNDGACDPWGFFWVGATAQDDRPGAAALYRMDADRTVSQVLDASASPTASTGHRTRQ